MTLTVTEKTETISTQNDSPGFVQAQSVFIEFRNKRNRGEVNEDLLYEKYHEYRSAAYAEMVKRRLTFEEYSEIMTVYPDDISRIGWENYNAHIKR